MSRVASKTRIGRASRVWAFAWPGVFASLVATCVAGLAEGMVYVDGVYEVMSAAGFAGYFAMPVGAVLAWAGRGLWLGWGVPGLVAAHTEESGGAPGIAAWLVYVEVGLATLGFAALNVVYQADETFTFPRVAALASAMALTMLAALLIALSRPVTRVLTHGFRRLDRAWVARFSRSPLRPRNLLVVSLLVLVGYLVGVWFVSVSPRVGHLDLGVEVYGGVFVATGIAAYAAWWLVAERRGRRGRGVLGGAAVVGWLVLMGTALHARHARPFIMLDVWGAAPMAGFTVDTVYRLDHIRAEFELSGISPEERAGERRDIVLITVDTLRADRTPPYGGKASMPALARMADSGLVFKWAFSPGNTTRRSLPTMATGLSPHRVRGRPVGWALKLDPRHVLLSERFRAAGYETAGFFCCPGQFDPDRRIGMHRGFEHIVIERDGSELVSMALAWLRARRESGQESGRPLFVWIHLFEPHRWDQRYPSRKYGPEIKPRYDRMLADTDAVMAPLIEWVIAPAQRDSLYAIVTSDHGEGLGDHGEKAHSSSLYNTQVHVPFLITGPGVGRARIDMPVSLVDLVPTLLDLAGFEPPGMPEMDGESLGPYVRGEREARLEKGEARVVQIQDRSVAESMDALIQGRYKVILGPGGERQLYDYIADPGEKRNLWSKYPDRAAQMVEALEERAQLDEIPPF